MTNNLQEQSTAESEAIAYLRTPQAIRDRCGQLFDLALRDELPHFRLDLAQLAPTAAYVLQVMRDNYPTLAVPFHSRWRHFAAGGVDRTAAVMAAIAPQDPIEQARIQFDLVILSVLLDAGAGATWKYLEPTTGQVYTRSEGLAVASFHAFCQGTFAADPSQPLRADAAKLQQITVAELADAFQVSDRNPLVGLEGRVTLLQSLGQVLQEKPEYFGRSDPRPGGLVDYLLQQVEWSSTQENQQVAAPQILQAVLTSLGDIWPGRASLAGVNLGDVWPHPALPADAPGANLVPFHKLSQWLTYSLLEPLQHLGLTITGLDQMTGLAEYRNGGLMLDMGLIQPKQKAMLMQKHTPGSPVIVEWRSLTLILLDRIAATLRQQLGQDEQQLPLVKVLEGGTWLAGRKIAAAKRPDASPPLQIESDGTVF